MTPRNLVSNGLIAGTLLCVGLATAQRAEADFFTQELALPGGIYVFESVGGAIAPLDLGFDRFDDGLGTLIGVELSWNLSLSGSVTVSGCQSGPCANLFTWDLTGLSGALGAANAFIDAPMAGSLVEVPLDTSGSDDGSLTLPVEQIMLGTLSFTTADDFFDQFLLDAGALRQTVALNGPFDATTSFVLGTGTGDGGWWAYRLTYEYRVPAPVPVTLLAVGLLGLGVVRRRGN